MTSTVFTIAMFVVFFGQTLVFLFRLFVCFNSKTKVFIPHGFKSQVGKQCRDRRPTDCSKKCILDTLILSTRADSSTDKKTLINKQKQTDAK